MWTQVTQTPEVVRDTIVTIQIRDTLGTAVDFATLTMAVTLAVLAAMMALMLRDIRSNMAGAQKTLNRTLAPIQERGTAIADNVEFITAALRADVTRLTGSVKALNDRLQQASDHMEERIEDFNALMEVVQGEAEELFLDAASTAHGVKVGARTALRGKKGDGGPDGGGADADRLEAGPGPSADGARDGRVAPTHEGAPDPHGLHPAALTPPPGADATEEVVTAPPQPVPERPGPRTAPGEDEPPA